MAPDVVERATELTPEDAVLSGKRSVLGAKGVQRNIQHGNEAMDLSNYSGYEKSNSSRSASPASSENEGRWADATAA
jgi:hypothetical protein